MLHRRPPMQSDYEGRCGNCHARIGEDAYCRYCGTKAGEGHFFPYEDRMQCVYGPPPVMRLHTCTACGYAWESSAMIDREKYCPQCGGKVTAEVTEEPFGIGRKPFGEE